MTITAEQSRPTRRIPRNRILLGDALERLGQLPTDSVDCVITSPPYFLRDYGIDGQLGLESNVDQFVPRLLAVTDELGRVLTPTSSLWLNLGDSYSRAHRYGAAPKALLLAPERVLLALCARGWVVRNKVVWAKPNPMPSSVRDRLTCTWEYLFHLVRSRHYFYDLDAIRVPHRSRSRGLTTHGPRAKAKSGPSNHKPPRPSWAGPLAGRNDGLIRARAEGRAGHPLGKNPGDVWTLPTAPSRHQHFAVFPEALVERPLRATCPKRVCTRCSSPTLASRRNPQCRCRAAWRPGLVLDPFMGAGTTALVAERLGHDSLGIEINPNFKDLALARIRSRGRGGQPPARGGDA